MPIGKPVPDSADDEGMKQALLRHLNELEKACGGVSRFSKTLRRFVETDSDAVTISDSLAELSILADKSSELAQRSQDFKRQWLDASKSAVLRLEADLRTECSRRAWAVDGQWPTLYVQRAIRVEIDQAKGLASVGTKKLRSLSLSGILNSIEAEGSTLLPRGFRPEQFIETLVTAYDTLTVGRAQQVSIWDLYRQMVLAGQSSKFWRDARARDFIEISADQFRARLSHTLSVRRARTRDGREIRLFPPLNAKDAMFVFQPAENRFGFVGRVELARTDEGGTL